MNEIGIGSILRMKRTRREYHEITVHAIARFVYPSDICCIEKLMILMANCIDRWHLNGELNTRHTHSPEAIMVLDVMWICSEWHVRHNGLRLLCLSAVFH